MATGTLSPGSRLALAVAACLLAGAAPRAFLDAPLTPGDTVTRSIGAGASQQAIVEASSGEFVRLVFEGGGAVVRVRFEQPDGARLLEEERRGGDRDSIVWMGLARQTGRHVLTVESLESDAAPRSYSLTLAERRAATNADAVRIDGWRRAVEALKTARAEAGAGRSHQAIASLQRAVDAARQAGEARFEAELLVRTGRLQGEAGESQHAEPSLKAALAIYQRLGDTAGRAEALCELGSVAGMRSRNTEAIDLFMQSAALARTANDRRTEATALNMLGVVTSYLGDTDRASSSYQAALALRRRIDDEAGVGQTLGNLGVLSRSLGEPRTAIAYYEEALKIRRARGAVQGVGTTLHNLAVVWADLGDHDRALALFRESLEIMRATGGRRGEAFNLNSIGQSYGKLGDAEQALSHLSQSLPIWREQGDKRGEALALLSIGSIYAGRGTGERARQAFEDALELAREAGYKREAGIALASLAGTDVARGNPQHAIPKAQEAVELARAAGERREEGRALAVLGSALGAAGQPDQARHALGSAIDHFVAIEDRALESSARAALADVLAGSDAHRALAERLNALDLVESLRGDVGIEGLRLSFFAAKRPMYERTIDLLMTLHRRDRSLGLADRALETSERARARSLLDLLSQAGVDRGREESTAAIDRRRTQESISAKAARLTRLLNTAKPDPAAVAALRRELDVLLTRDAELRRTLGRDHSVATAVEAEPVAADQLRRAALGPDTVLLEYWLGDRESYLWAVTEGGTRTAVLPGRAEIERLAREAYGALTEPARSTAGDDAATVAARLDASRRGFETAAAALSQVLLAPVAAELVGRRILVVADGALQYLPFAALPTPGRPEVPLLDEHEVVSLPSASVLVALKSRAASRPAPSPRILVLADPVFARDDVRVGAAATHGAAPTAPATPGALDANGNVFARLRFSRDEALRIQALAPRATTMALDFRAGREAVTTPTLGQFGIIHFAAHTVLNDRRPELSGLALSLVDQRGRDQNGFLRLHDLYNLSLNARLVVLSACSTALGTETPGEGLIGLARGFLHAGADAVVASLWEVNDRASAELMQHFYTRMLSARRSPSGALRDAQQWMRRNQRRRHPYYWAGWTVLGSETESVDPSKPHGR
jgi:CHAT domain-containing protein/tetratricopeptide (TPR) repeat protein